MKEAYLKVLKIFLPLLFMAYMGGISFFTHTHIVNGVTIVHSHPYKSDANHEHDTAAFELIAHLNTVHLPASIGLLFLLGVLLVLLRNLVAFIPEPSCIKSHFTPISPRAPPIG